jgi:hypothetical protein
MPLCCKGKKVAPEGEAGAEGAEGEKKDDEASTGSFPKDRSCNIDCIWCVAFLVWWIGMLAVFYTGVTVGQVCAWPAVVPRRPPPLSAGRRRRRRSRSG